MIEDPIARAEAWIQEQKKMQEEKPIKPTRQKAETFDIGQYTKKVSNLVADPDKY